jgi:predicted RNA-binding Zn ribbon-like protein
VWVKGVNVLFAHDTELALMAAAALVNTATDVDALPDLAALEEFLDAWGWTGSRRRTRGELDRVKALRPQLRELWLLDEAGVVKRVNAMLKDASALPQLVSHGEFGPHLHATSPSAPLADRMAVEAAMALVDVVRQDELDRLRVCESSTCDAVLVDLSKNSSRRFCSTTCQNRLSVAASRARRRAGPDPEQAGGHPKVAASAASSVRRGRTGRGS